MKRTYLLTIDNEIVVYPSRKEAEAAAEQASDDIRGFDSVESLESALSACAAGRAVEIFNALPGVEPVKSFKSKSQAAARIFKALSSLGDEAGATIADALEPVAKPKRQKRERKPKAEKKPRKSAKKAKTKTGKKSAKYTERAKGDSKKAQVIEMISKKGGATMGEIMKATGWQAHSCRGAISTLASKGGHHIESFKSKDGERAYRIA